MKSKPITADSNHASELSDAALLDIFGGSTGYAPAADAGSSASVHVVIDVSCDASEPAHAAPIATSPLPAHTSSPSTTVATTTPITPAATGSLQTQAQPPHLSSPNQMLPPNQVTSAAQKVPAPADHPLVPVEHAIPAPQGGKDAQPGSRHTDQDGHHGHLREAFEAAHDRFHDALDHAHDGFDHLLDGAAEAAAAAIELNPVVAGLHLLHDLRHPGSSTTPKKP